MNDYLKGFIDGYNKALEKDEKSSVSVDGKELAKGIYKDIAELIEKDNARRDMM